jgi:rhodanese-related sulfurtransferase
MLKTLRFVSLFFHLYTKTLHIFKKAHKINSFKKERNFFMNSINVQDFQLLLNQSIAILDIRDASAFSEGHLPDAISMPTTSLPNRLNELDENTTYYVLSHSGRRSDIIAQFLNNHGYKAIHVIGGMKALRKEAA